MRINSISWSNVLTAMYLSVQEVYTKHPHITHLSYSCPKFCIHGHYEQYSVNQKIIKLVNPHSRHSSLKAAILSLSVNVLIRLQCKRPHMVCKYLDSNSERQTSDIAGISDNKRRRALLVKYLENTRPP